MKKVQIYVAASPKDHKYLSELVRHLGRRKDPPLEVLHREALLPGSDVFIDSDKSMRSCHVFIALLSADFVEDVSCMSQLQVGLLRSAENQVQLILVLVRSFELDGLVPEGIAIWPVNRKPVNSHRDREAVWTEIAREVIRRSKQIVRTQDAISVQEEQDGYFNSIRNGHLLYFDRGFLQEIRERLQSENGDHTLLKARNLGDKEDLIQIIRYLKRTNALSHVRPSSMKNDDIGDDRAQWYVLERTKARKVILPKHRIKCVDGLREFAIWVADPPSADLILNKQEEYSFRGTFLFMLQSNWTHEKYQTVWSGYSAFRLILKQAWPPIKENKHEWEPYGRGNYLHPIDKLAELSPLVMDERDVVVLYRKRVITNELCFTIAGEKYRGCDLWGYPIAIVAMP